MERAKKIITFIYDTHCNFVTLAVFPVKGQNSIRYSMPFITDHTHWMAPGCNLGSSFPAGQQGR